MLSKGSASQLQYNPLKKLPEVDQQLEQQQPLLQTLSTPQKYRVSPMDLMRPVKTKAETVSLYTEWANHYLQKAGYECFITDLQNDLRDGKMLINLTHAVVNEHVILKGSNRSSRDIIVACLKVLEEIGVEVHDVSVDGILSGRLKCILGLFFNLSKFKQKLRECQSQPKQIVQSGIPQKSGDSPLTSTSLDSPDSDRRYVTPPSSVQSGVQHQSRPLSDPQALRKPIDSKSRLPVFRQNRTKNCLSDSPQPKSGEVTASSLPTRSIRSPQPIKNQKNPPSKAPNSSLGSPGTNPPMFPISRPGGGLVKHPSSLPQPTSIQTRSLMDFGGSRPIREISAETPLQQPISKSTVMNNTISPPLFTKPHIQYYPPSNYPGVSQLPAPTLSFNAGVLRFNRPSDFLPQSLTPTASSKSSSFASLSSSNGGHPLPNSSKVRHNEHEEVNGEKDEEGEGEESPLGSGEINRAMSQLEDVNPGTWSGRLPPTLPGISTSNGQFYLTTARQRASLDPHLHNEKISTSVNHNDGDNKSIKSECLPGKDLNRPMKRLGIPPTLYSSESNLFTPDTWSNSLPNRPFHRAIEVTTMESPSTLAQLRARADGREEVPTERNYGPLGLLKLPYDPPRSHIDHGEVKSPYSVLGCTNMKHSDDGAGSEEEICHLRRELESARQKVTTLTSQLELNTHSTSVHGLTVHQTK
ncbi:Neuron navigator 3 [Taenia crassiceps]|uniref:Neuron navigator 3 n=1 Tax=Taenia crassiceps TaxID=6207 RepID=A0ABR4Q3X0_9CEST